MDDDAPQFAAGDIVWVKLGPTWWPGEVQDSANLPSDVAFKVPPLYVVKFFEEDSYEYVKNAQFIHPYNGERKNDFIKKGMTSFRAKVSHMQKFPKDVSLAESKTDGNPNILSEPQFQPEKRRNYSEDFGTPSPKKTPKLSEKKKKLSISKKKLTPNITHRRFLGFDDYHAEVCIQFPGKDVMDPKDAEEVIRINEENGKVFQCQKCPFVSDRLEVFIWHTKSHIQGVYSSAPSAKKTRKPTVKKLKKDKRKLDDSDMSAGDEETPKPVKRKPIKKRKLAKPVEEKPKNIRNDLLAEWDDSDDDEPLHESKLVEKYDDDERDTPTPPMKESQLLGRDSDDDDDFIADEADKSDKKPDESGAETSPTKDVKKDIKSCFDFDEEDEEEPAQIAPTVVGRKIPRVIPTNDKRRSGEQSDNESAERRQSTESKKSDDDLDKEQTLKTSQSFNQPAAEEEQEKDEEHEKAFKELLESTAVPALSGVETTLKCEQNFHETNTVKFPDKTEPTESPTSDKATKLTNPKKRFVKSFEDFEQSQLQKKSTEEKKVNILSEEVTKPAEEDKKLDSDKKPSDNDAIKKVEDKKDKVKDDKKLKSGKTKQSEVSEKPAPVEPEETLKISKLKTRIMTKMQEQPEEQSKTDKDLLSSNVRRVNQSPRNKFLESYNNETKDLKESEAKQKENDSNRQAIEERLGIDTLKEKSPERRTRRSSAEKPTTSQKEVCPPKKKIWSRRRTSSRKESLNEDSVPKPEPAPEESKPSPVVPEDAKVEPEVEKPKEEEQTVLEPAPVAQESKSEDLDILGSKSEDFSLSAVLPDDAICAPIAESTTLEELVTEVAQPEAVPVQAEPVQSACLSKEEEQSVLALAALAGAPVIDSTELPQPQPVEDKMEIDNTKVGTVAETDLATAEAEIQPPVEAIPPPVTEVKQNIQSFSMDCTEIEESILDSKVVKSPKPKPPTSTKLDLLDILEGNDTKTPEIPVPQKPKEVPMYGNDILDFEEHIPSQIVRTKSKNPDEDRPEPPKPVIKKIQPAIIHKTKIKTVKPAEKMIKPATDVNPYNRTFKRDFEDEDMEAFIIPKIIKKVTESESPVRVQSPSRTGKVKILQQTVITPEGNIIQPKGHQVQQDDAVFDINSMPIVLSDELTPETIERLPIVLDETKAPKTPIPPKKIFNQGIRPQVTKLIKAKIGGLSTQVQTPTRIIKPPIVTSSPSNNKYMIMPKSASSTPVKKPSIIKRSVPAQSLSKIGPLEGTGNKIMIVTNQQGERQRVVLTPADQKRIGLSSVGTKLVKPIIKSQLVQKTLVGNAGPSGLKAAIPRTPPTEQKMLVNKTGKAYVRQKTILIKNQQGQTVKTIQGTDDELLEKQVAENLEQIKQSNALRLQQKQQEMAKVAAKAATPIKKSYVPKKASTPVVQKSTVPPLSPLSSKKPEVKVPTPERAPNQMVIQDPQGNQTTITEGQILALPSETLDGQPQSYMLVTVDESGNLVPLNNEALMSLNPSLLEGLDLNSMVLQIDQNAAESKPTEAPKPKPQPAKEVPVSVPVPTPAPEPVQVPVPEPEPAKPEDTEGGQQLIVTGDPIATQKFLETLAEGSTDLANILANAEGSILIHADGQQILINTNSDNQILVNVTNNDQLATEADGNPMFANQAPNKNQDILAAALADTDFQQDQAQKVPSQLSPGSTLYPMNVGNVLETSLTLNSPIMTPLEVPSTNSKKIPDEEADILTQIPKNVSLPITITDPNISQTVQQQVLLGAADLPGNLELNLPITETTVSTEMNSPSSFAYSLSALDDINQKPFNSSMPLLTEDVDVEPKGEDGGKDKLEEEASTCSSSKEIVSDSNGEDKKDMIGSVEGFMEEEEEGLCTLGGEMCSSLSEPPPDMFDLPGGTFLSNSAATPSEEDRASNVTEHCTNSSTTVASEDSCEIPVQPSIVADFVMDKECKFD